MTDKTVVIVTHRPAALSIVDEVVDFGNLQHRGPELEKTQRPGTESMRME